MVSLSVPQKCLHNVQTRLQLLDKQLFLVLCLTGRSVMWCWVPLVSDSDACFTDKVDAVRVSTSTMPLYDVPLTLTKSSSDSCTTVTIDEVNKLISASPNKTCQLDPVPTWLVKEMRELLAPFITLLFNRSLVTGCFPSEFKLATVRPLLKKSGLNASDLKNYRPVVLYQTCHSSRSCWKGWYRWGDYRLFSIATSWCQLASSQRTVSTTALR